MRTRRLCRGGGSFGLGAALGRRSSDARWSRHSRSPLERLSRGTVAPDGGSGMSGTRRKPGLLGPYVEGYSAWLIRRGHTALTARNMLKEFGQIGRWLAEEGLEVRQLSEERLVAFLAARRRAGYRRLPGLRGLKPPLAYLREVGAVDPATVPITALDELLGEYRDWLVRRPRPGSGDSAAVCQDRPAVPGAVLSGRCGAVGSDRERGECVPDRRVRPGVGRLGEGTGS